MKTENGLDLVLFSVEQTAEMCNVGRQAITKAVKSGRLKTVRISNRRFLMTLKGITEWLEKEEQFYLDPKEETQ